MRVSIGRPRFEDGKRKLRSLACLPFRMTFTLVQAKQPNQTVSVVAGVSFLRKKIIGKEILKINGRILVMNISIEYLYITHSVYTGPCMPYSAPLKLPR